VRGGAAAAAAAAAAAEAPAARAFFPRLAFANHDCEPNAEADEEVEAEAEAEAETEAAVRAAADAATAAATLPEAPARFAYTLTARRAIAEGEEVTISYVPRAWPLARRRGALSSTFDFDCDCARCAREAAEEAAEAAR